MMFKLWVVFLTSILLPMMAMADPLPSQTADKYVLLGLTYYNIDNTNKIPLVFMHDYSENQTLLVDDVQEFRFYVTFKNDCVFGPSAMAKERRESEEIPADNILYHADERGMDLGFWGYGNPKNHNYTFFRYICVPKSVMIPLDLVGDGKPDVTDEKDPRYLNRFDRKKFFALLGPYGVQEVLNIDEQKKPNWDKNVFLFPLNRANK